MQVVQQLPFGIENLLDQDVFGAAPFVKDFRESHECAPKYIGPDECEMSSQLFAYRAEGMQARRMAPSITPLMAVPSGLSAEDHFLAGLHASSPLEQEGK